jgi:hypothetical protein
MPNDVGVPLLCMKHLSAPVLWFMPMQLICRKSGVMSKVPRTEAL